MRLEIVCLEISRARRIDYKEQCRGRSLPTFSTWQGRVNESPVTARYIAPLERNRGADWSAVVGPRGWKVLFIQDH